MLVHASPPDGGARYTGRLERSVFVGALSSHRMVSTDWLVTAALGTAASFIGLFLLWLARTGSHEDLRPPTDWGADLGLVSVEQTRTRRLIWAGYGLVSLLVGLAFFVVLVVAF
jgi:hypothetical protein